MLYDCVSYVSLQHCKRKDDDDDDDIDTDVLCVHDIVILYGSVCYTVINTCVEKRREGGEEGEGKKTETECISLSPPLSLEPGSLTGCGGGGQRRTYPHQTGKLT